MADASHLVERDLTFKGTYHVNLFQSDVFSGMLTISGYPYATGQYPMRDLKIAVKDSATIAYEVEPSDKWNESKYVFLGEFFSNRFLRNTVILVYKQGALPFENEGFSSMDGTCIVSSAKNQKEALARFKQVVWTNNRS